MSEDIKEEAEDAREEFQRAAALINMPALG